jgi:hypothetical protein
MHMLLPYHQSEYRQLPDEDKVRTALRAAGVKQGLYVLPHTTHKDMKSPAMAEKYKEGPVGMMTIAPNGPPAMPRFLGLWFAYTLIIGFFVGLSHEAPSLLALPTWPFSASRGTAALYLTV